MPVDAYLGEISMAGYNYAPDGTYACEGQLLPISSNTALFSLLGTTFGGDGVSTFGLPDLRGRVPMGAGQGGGLSFRVMGEMAGTETVTLTTNQMPTHNHAVTVNPKAVNDAGTTSDPTNAYPANSGALDREYATAGTAVNMAAATATAAMAGGNQAHNNMPPFLVLNFYIAWSGSFPPRP